MDEVGIVTLTSDLGIRDPYVAIIKGELLKSKSSLSIIDIAHDLNKHDVEHVAYVLNHAIQHFTPGTVHLAICDLNAGKNQTILIAFWHNQWIVTTNNGLIPLIDEKINEVYAFTAPSALKPSFLAIEWLLPPAIRLINKEHPSTWAQLTTDYLKWLVVSASVSNTSIRANVMYIDSYNNVILNIKQKEFEDARQNRRFKLELSRDIFAGEISKGYHDVQEGEFLLLFNSNGNLELALNKGNLARLFNLKLRDSILIVFY